MESFMETTKRAILGCTAETYMEGCHVTRHRTAPPLNTHQPTTEHRSRVEAAKTHLAEAATFISLLNGLIKTDEMNICVQGNPR